jgi:ABC-type Fe3+ transport system substrate-binding protein
MKTKLIIVGVFALAVIVILIVSLAGKSGSPAGDASAEGGDAATPPAGNAVEITMIYSSEKKDWIEAAAVPFRKDHPEIKLTLTAKGSLAAAQGIVDDKDKPTIFSPADSLIMSMLASDWKTKKSTALFATSGDEAPQSLVITPIVLAIWEDRAQVLLKAGKGRITWKSIRDAIKDNKGWSGMGGKPEWGFVKLGHTDPTQSNSGIEALYLMSLEYYGKNTLDVGDLMKPEYQTFISEIEKGVTKFETSTGKFMDDMVRFGPSKYDIAVVYENLAIAQLDNAKGRWGHLRIYYPGTTVWSDHPAGILQADWVTPEQKAAAKLWLTHLHSKPMQEQALAAGFRPGDPSVPVKSPDPNNPWTKNADNGVQVDIPPVAPTPEGPIVHNLITMWSRVTQK